MNKIVSCIFFLVTTAGFAQDSTTVKNNAKISELMNRIDQIESVTSPAPNEYEEEIIKLNLKLKVQRDSIDGLRKKVNALLAEKKVSNYLELVQRTECNCNRIFYEPNQAVVDYVKFSELDSIARLASSKNDYKIRLIGHSDKTGPESINTALAKQRAEGIKNYLVKVKGLKEEFINTEGHGSALPIITTQDQGKLIINRRAEIFLTYPL